MQWRVRTLTGIRRETAVLAVLSLATLVAAASLAEAAPRGFLGVQLQEIDSALSEALDLGEVEGVLVTEVVEDSPAEAAGLQRGDIITSFDGRSVRSARSLTRMVERTDVGETVTLRLLRKGKPEAIEVEIGRRESPTRAPRVFELNEEPGRAQGIFLDRDRARLGVRVEEIDAKLGRYFDAEEGLLVLDVFEDSAAEDAGIEVGDVLVEVDGEAITEVEDLHELLAEHEDGDQVAVKLLRDKQPQSVQVEVRVPEEIEVSELLPHGSHMYRWYGDDGSWHRLPPRAPRVPRLREFDDDRGDEIEELRRELRELRKELEELKEM